jgi:hypothetical protein
MTTPLKPGDAAAIAENLEKLEKLGAAAAARPEIRKAAAALPGLIGKGIGRLRTPTGPLPGTQLTESPKSYSDRAVKAPGTAAYFDKYTKQRPATVPDDATIEAVPAGAVSQSTKAGTAVKDPPKVRITDRRGTPIAGVAVRFAIITGASTVASQAALTDAKGEASAGGWTLTSAGTHSLQALAGPLFLTFDATGT